MPELPEVESLAAFLRGHATGHAVARADAASFSVLKTFDPPLATLNGQVITEVGRHGKFLDLATDQGLHLIIHLARAGWLRWREELPSTPPKPGKSPLAFRLALDDHSGFDLTEQGTHKRLAVYLVRDPAEVPGVATLGPDPLAAEAGERRIERLQHRERGRVGPRDDVARRVTAQEGGQRFYFRQFRHASQSAT